MFENLLFARDGAVAVLTINRPGVLNALDAATLHEIDAALALARDDDAVRALVVTGTGPTAFAAGADLREIASLAPDEARRYAERGQRVFGALERLGKPSVAAVNGFALGGGCELAMACSVRIAARTASLGLPEVSLGLMPGFAGTQRLPRLVGRGVALEMLLTGRRVAAEEALRIGLVGRVVPAADLMTEALALARMLAERAPLAVRHVLDVVRAGLDGSLEQGERLEAEAFAVVASSADAREGTRAFLEKRAPRFEGR